MKSYSEDNEELFKESKRLCMICYQIKDLAEYKTNFAPPNPEYRFYCQQCFEYKQTPEYKKIKRREHNQKYRSIRGNILSKYSNRISRPNMPGNIPSVTNVFFVLKKLYQHRCECSIY